jgi:hypothetical protein
MMSYRVGNKGQRRMTSEQRLDRIERILKLMVKAGLRARRDVREQDEKIDIIVDYQIETEKKFQQNQELFRQNQEMFRQNEERFKQNEERFKQNEERFALLAEAQTRLAEAQTRLTDSHLHSGHKLNALIHIVRKGRYGRISTR